MSTVLSLARKWRPQTFEDLVGQEFVVRAVTNALKARKLPQAFLFSGERGVGKTTVARILAKAINCEKGPTPNPCQECESCREITQGSAPDVCEIDGASHTSVDDVRTLREGIRYLPLKSRTRVYIIDEVHMLSQAAFNALLKTLEEPPPHVVFVFATTEDHKIPDTILSRCQHFRFRSLNVAEITQELEKISREEGIPFQRSTLNLLARAAGGSMRDGLSLLDQVRFLSDGLRSEEDIALFLGTAGGLPEKRLLEALLTGNLEQVVKETDAILSRGVDPRMSLRSLGMKVRDLLLSKTLDCPLGNPRFGWAPEEIPDIPPQSEPTPFLLEQALSVLLRGEDEIRRSSQAGVTFLLILCRIAHIRNVLPIPEILKRLESAEPHSPKPPAQNLSAPSSSRETQKSGTEKGSSNPPSRDIRLSKNWRSVIAEWSDMPGTLRDLLDQCDVSRTEEDHYILRAPNGFFEKRILESHPDIVRALSRSLGHTVRISVMSGTPDPSDESQSMDSLVKNDPLVREALSLFGGQIIATRKGSFEEPSIPPQEKQTP